MNSTRRDFLKWTAAGAAAAALPSLLQGATGAGPRPNFVIIQNDSMDGRVIHCAGHPAAYTPNIDALAARGALFHNTYCSSPLCVPSRASMFSGLHTHQCEAWNNSKGIGKGTPTFLTELGKAGYTLSVHGKTDYGSGAHGFMGNVAGWTRTADIRLVYGQYGVEVRVKWQDADFYDKEWDLARTAADSVKKNAAAGKPFLVYAGFGIPHVYYRGMTKWLEKIDPAKVALPPKEIEHHAAMDLVRLQKGADGPYPDDWILKLRRTYYSMIAEFDAMLAEIVAAVEAAGVADNTYIIFVSDHGDMQMEHSMIAKCVMYEGAVRVPLVIAGPAVKKGTVVERPTSLVDVFPTIMDMADLQGPKNLSGCSLMADLTGRPSNHPDYVLSQYHGNFAVTGFFMLRRGDWKYIAYPGYEPQLFNLKDDPDEIHNLVARQSDVVKEMDAKLREAVDYPAVDAKVKEYDKRSFREWRASVNEKTYRGAMGFVYTGFGDKEEQEIQAWLARA